MRLPVTLCLLRDGTIFFLILLAISIANLLSLFPARSLIEFLPPILVSRFLLNLRDCTGSNTTDRSLPRLSELSVHFATSNVSNIIGNIGAPLDYAQAERLIRAEYERPGDKSGVPFSDTAASTAIGM
ncbi:uncharacterized protein PHACADRAFT_207126 [Phanerochaete carnosa HHB-10118-sp]|nr:uncharacterized protein PHACADRAFT_207126 [Phanerochaete carnosa HHB-10118-sp]EKM58289.1 hypothetical protein PHACADRAFT_207126 [Phanerochaete carnosa HHB-10118-sp]